MSFGMSAARLAGLAAQALGWRPGEFWMATPAELAGALGLVDGDAGDTGDGALLARLMARFPDTASVASAAAKEPKNG